MLEFIGGLIIQFIQASGYLGVFILMTLESALIPIPSEITMAFAGSLVVVGTFSFWPLVLVGALANLVGSLLAYGLGYLGEDQVLRFIRRFGKFVFIREKEYHHATGLFNRYGEIIAFGSRLLPAIRTYISLPAGIARMDVRKFSVYTFLGSFFWCAVLVYAGVVLGGNWRSLEVYFRKFELLIGGALILGAGLYLWRHFRAK